VILLSLLPKWLGLQAHSITPGPGLLTEFEWGFYRHQNNPQLQQEYSNGQILESQKKTRKFG
jgi:hypothetical protein